MKTIMTRWGAYVALALFLAAGVALMAHAGIDPVHGTIIAMAAAPALEDWQRELSVLQTAFEERDTSLKALIEKGNGQIAETGKMAEETRMALQELVSTGQKLQMRMLDVEQKLGRRGGGGGANVLDLEKMFTESPSFKQLQAGQSRSARIELKRHELINMSITTTGSVTGGSIVVPDRQPGIISPATRKPLVRDLLMPGRTSSNAIEFVQETGFTNNANVVSEGVTKPQSQLTFEIQSRSVRTIAHWVKASKQILDDVPQLLSYVSGRLKYGLQFKEDYQLLRGDNTAQNLDGLIPNATAYDTGRNDAGDTRIDVIRHAITQVRMSEYYATGIVLNPEDWDGIETEKDNQGRDIWVNVAQGGIPQLWKLPVIDHTAMNAGEFLVGAFSPAGQIFDREDASVVVSNEDNDNFTRNMVTILVEERLVQAIYRPEAFVYGDFGAIT